MKLLVQTNTLQNTQFRVRSPQKSLFTPLKQGFEEQYQFISIMSLLSRFNSLQR